MIRVTAAIESWPIAGEFRTARGGKTAAEVVVVRLDDGECVGVGECLPYPRYGESAETTARLINEHFATGRNDLDTLRVDTGCHSANNALDCAAWDLLAQQSGTPVWDLAGLPAPQPVVTALTIGLGPVADMAQAAAAHRHRDLLKIKLGSTEVEADAERLQAIRASAPDSTLIVDANEGWSMSQLERIVDVASAVDVRMIEQPLPAAADEPLRNFGSPVPFGADESVHREADLDDLREKYAVVNVKLDKTGGLSRASSLCARARALNIDVMIGCMVATSLSMAPALLLTQGAAYVDLDGPLLLRRDRQPGLTYVGDQVAWPDTPFWGEPREV